MNPGVPIPNFDDIKVIPDEDVPKPKSNSKIEMADLPIFENLVIEKPSKKMKEVWFKGRKTIVAYNSSDESESESERSGNSGDESDEFS